MGAPPGNNHNPNGRPSFKKALERVLEENGGRYRPALERIARQAVKKAISGDVRAMEFVADRLDGKPVQAIEHSGSVGLNIILEKPVP